MVESNYPDVVKVVTEVLNQFDAQSAKYPDQPLFINIKEYPIVQNLEISNRDLSGVGIAMSLNDVYLGTDQTRIDLSDQPKQNEPGLMAEESTKLVMFDLAKRNISVPANGLTLLKQFFYGIYARKHEVIVSNIYHPESIVMNILSQVALAPIWNRSGAGPVSPRLTNYLVVPKFNISSFVGYMTQFNDTMEINDFYINSQKYRINLNSMKVGFENGGIWDRNSRTFGTWSSFPKDGDYFYGINLAGAILGLINEQIPPNMVSDFMKYNWENKITYLCVAAAMNPYVFSYILG